MKPYRRFVAYVYAYENNKKGENRGFVKVESKMGRCYMNFQVKGFPQELQECEIFGFYYTDDVMEGISLGKAEVAEGMLTAELEADSEDLMGSGVGLEQLGGLLLSGGEEVRLGTEWEDRPIAFDSFRLWRDPAPAIPESVGSENPAGQQEEAQQPRQEQEAENHPKAETMEREEPVAENHPGMKMREREKSEAENRPETVEREEPKSENQPETETGESQELWAENRSGAETVEHQGREAENRSEAETGERKVTESENPLPAEAELVVEENPGACPEREKTDGEGQDDLVDLQLQEELYRTEHMQEATPDQDNKVQQQAELRREQQNAQQSQQENLRREQQNARQEQQAELRREQQNAQQSQQAELRREQQNARQEQQAELRREQQNTRPGRQNTQGDQQERKTDVHMQRRRTCPAELALQRDWENMQQEYPHLEEIKDGDWEDAIQINPQDVRRLRQRNWTVGNNNFLLHAYNSYHYLVLAKIAGRNQYVLAVPGVFDHQERFMASMFGFPNFKSAQPGKMQMGQFGYWYRPIC